MIFGLGGLGHVGLQYAKAMGMNTVAVDIHDHALSLAKELGADITINSSRQNPGTLPSLPIPSAYAQSFAGDVIHKEVGGAHGCLVTAVAAKAFQVTI